MLIWPWTNINKKISHSFKKSFDVGRKVYTVEEVFKHISERRKPKFYKELIWDIHDIVWKVYRYFKPYNNYLRKVIPKEWVSLNDLLIATNFAMLKNFYENDMHDIQWTEYGPFREDCKRWLDVSYLYITKERDVLENQLYESYPKVSARASKNGTYEEMYAETIRLEKMLEKRDDEVLSGLVKYRSILWH
jgi:hypothetical protein